MDIQKLLDVMGDQARMTRANYGMTLGRLIDTLERLDPDMPTLGFGKPHSYRGYYSDLAFEPDSHGYQPVKDVLAVCRQCLGKEFTGYKGGEFRMERNTPVWFSAYGTTGERLMSLDDSDGTLRPITEPEKWDE